jgi:isopenicillin N synthase-like dioxygenase
VTAVALPVIDVGPLVGPASAAARAEVARQLHGRNLFPRQVPRLRSLVLAYLDALTRAGQAVLAGVALSLGLDAGYFATGYTADPTILFRIFHYPPPPPQSQDWGVSKVFPQLRRDVLE